jgi:hypothetical protein
MCNFYMQARHSSVLSILALFPDLCELFDLKAQLKESELPPYGDIATMVLLLLLRAVGRSSAHPLCLIGEGVESRPRTQNEVFTFGGMVVKFGVTVFKFGVMVFTFGVNSQIFLVCKMTV